MKMYEDLHKISFLGRTPKNIRVLSPAFNKLKFHLQAFYYWELDELSNGKLCDTEPNDVFEGLLLLCSFNLSNKICLMEKMPIRYKSSSSTNTMCQ